MPKLVQEIEALIKSSEFLQTQSIDIQGLVDKLNNPILKTQPITHEWQVVLLLGDRKLFQKYQASQRRAIYNADTSFH